MNKKAKNRAIVLGAAVLGLAAAADAGVIMSVTNLGAPFTVAFDDGEGTTLAAQGPFTQYVAYKLTFSTTVGGEKITAIDMGGTAGASLTRGIFGPMAQVGVGGTTANPTKTPLDYHLNGGGTGTNEYTCGLSLDSHFLLEGVNVQAPTEDHTSTTNLLNYPAANTFSGLYGSTDRYRPGGRLFATFGVNVGQQAGSIDTAYVILPVGGTASVSAEIATSLTALNVVQGVIGSGGPVAGTNKVGLVSPSNLTDRGDVTVSGGNGKYVSTIFDAGAGSNAGTNTGYVDILGTLPTPVSDPVYALVDLANLPGTLASFLASLQNLGAEAFTTEVAGGANFDAIAAHYAAPGDGWDVLFKFAGTHAGGAGALDFAWDFGGDTGVRVEGVVVVPEPSMLGLAAIGGLGLLARRRRA